MADAIWNPATPVEPKALASSIAVLEAWEARADGEPLTQDEGESLCLALHELKRLIAATPSPPVAAPPATPVDSELWAILVDVNNALEDGVDALSEVRANFREAYKGHRPEEHAAKERDLLNAEAARAKLAEYMDRPRPAAQPQPQPAQPLTGAAAKVRAPLSDAQIEKLREATFSTSNPFCPCDSKTMRKAVWAAERAHGITAPSTPTPPEVAP